MDDRQLRKVLREWPVEDAPRSLDERVLGARQPWWKALMGGSVRVPVALLAGLAILIVAMGAALLRARAVPAAPAVSRTIDLAGFRPVEDVQVRIMRSGYAAQ
jgi:hypothetical protein